MTQEKPTAIFYNAQIITLDPLTPTAQALALTGQRILAVGNNRDLLNWKGPQTACYDLGGETIVPGFHDSHLHLLTLGQGLDSVDLTKARSAQELIELSREFGVNHPDRPWIIGRGWNEEAFQVKVPPQKQDLDRVSDSRPVVLTRVCGHVCVANSRALEMAGIGPETPDPPAGSIDRSGGEPSGVLRENAMALVQDLIPEQSLDDLKRILLGAAQSAASQGLTTVQSNDLHGERSLSRELEAYRQLAEAGQLPIRVILQAAMPKTQDLSAYLKLRASFPDYDGKLSLGPLKLFADGSLGARTAALTHPYQDDPANRGLTLYDQEELDELVGLAAQANLQVAVHAIGDRALDLVIESYRRAKESIPHWTARPRLIHGQITRKDQLIKMGSLGIVADIQPIFVGTDRHFVENRVGKQRSRYSYAWKTMGELGIKTAGGSDCPVESLNPLWGMHAAITRWGWHPQECLDPKEALALFTTGSAFAAGQEAYQGSLSPGKLADFVVLPEDPTATDPERLLDMRVTATYVGGRHISPAKPLAADRGSSR